MKAATLLDGWGIALGTLLLACVILGLTPEQWRGGMLLGLTFLATACLFVRACFGSK